MIAPSEKHSYILWLGVSSPSDNLIPGFSSRSAAEHWQQGAITGLKANSKSVAILSHESFPRWPKGPLCVDTNKVIVDPGPHTVHINVAYLNLPFSRLRNLSLKTNYLRALRKLVYRIGPPSLIISYNVFPHSLAVATYAKKRFNIKTTLIIADQPARGIFRNVAEFESRIISADHCAFLSWEMYERFRGKVPSIYFEGGVNTYDFSHIRKKTCEAASARIIMFCGSSSVHSGLQTLLESVPHLQSQNLELWITGPINNRIQAMCRNIQSSNCKVTTFGMLDNCDLEALMKKASIFVNPYSISHSPNRCNFPSKILLYLPYLMPIVSTWTAGLSPEYADLLCTVSNDTPSELAQKIDEVLSWDEEKLLRHRLILSSFVRKNAWSHKVLSLIQGESLFI